jgi:hypothetical protein
MELRDEDLRSDFVVVYPTGKFPHNQRFLLGERIQTELVQELYMATSRTDELPNPRLFR